MIKLNRLFYSPASTGAFYEATKVSPSKREYLVACKNKIREHLRPAIEAASTTLLGMDDKVTPRFRTQGSWAYGTCVQPCTMPPQEIDWDYGLYLPIAVLEENGLPKTMAKTYFDLVERELNLLCLREHWVLDRSKVTCIRLKVADWAHIDVPLYAASEEEFAKVRETVSKASMEGFRTMDSLAEGFAVDGAEWELSGPSWDEMDGIYLANRNGEWVESDPHDVAKWFSDRCEEHGPQLKRVCRFLKSWRDYQWPNGGPTSISIMIAVSQHFEPESGRDDLAIERSARLLAAALLLDIREPGIDGGKDDFNRLDDLARRDASARANALAQSLRYACSLSLPQAQRAVDELRSKFGDRLPNRPDWAEVDSAAGDIRKVPAVSVAPPVVGAMNAG